MNTMYQRHTDIEYLIADLREDALTIAKSCEDPEEQAMAYAQAEKYLDALRALQDFLMSNN